ncbi:hypothetical protein FQR65_LT11829 [Abscondita terminalis]|nr:hypothetical protein FQR65_LT11829 [Abscondita terminalis]
MALRPKSNSHLKRVVFSDNDVCTLVNLVYKYKNTVECKKTDVYTWKEKDAVWNKICKEFSSGATEPRTVEQLRTKYDNLKKETRRYFAKQRQNLYRTGGGPVEDNIRAVLRDIYEKIKAIINLSVQGMEPRLGDSDSITSLTASEITTTAALPCKDDHVMFECEPPHGNSENYTPPAAGDITKITTIVENQCTITNVDDVDNAENIQINRNCDNVQINDWSTYSPALLKTRKQKGLRVQKNTDTKPAGSTSTKVLQGLTIAKTELLALKKKLLIKEDERNEELHKERLEGQRLFNEKLYLQNIEKKLKNELLSVQIQNAKASL